MDQVPAQMIQILQFWAGSWPGIFLVTFSSLALLIPSWFLNDPGTFWHIRTGEWMLDHHQILNFDPFSQSQSNWIPTQWLAEILMACVYYLGGFTALTTFSSFIISVWISILARRWFLAGMHPILVWFLAISVLMIGAIHFLTRPLLVNFLGITMRHGRGHFVRALYEGIAFSLRDVLGEFRSNSRAYAHGTYIEWYGSDYVEQHGATVVGEATITCTKNFFPAQA
ncbi:hypothetical protein EBX93_05530, partial [bacterium]|nr:hypothetical protein [bacterium]